MIYAANIFTFTFTSSTKTADGEVKKAGYFFRSRKCRRICIYCICEPSKIADNDRYKSNYSSGQTDLCGIVLVAKFEVQIADLARIYLAGYYEGGQQHHIHVIWIELSCSALMPVWKCLWHRTLPEINECLYFKLHSLIDYEFSLDSNFECSMLRYMKMVEWWMLMTPLIPINHPHLHMPQVWISILACNLCIINNNWHAVHGRSGPRRVKQMPSRWNHRKRFHLEWMQSDRRKTMYCHRDVLNLHCAFFPFIPNVVCQLNDMIYYGPHAVRSIPSASLSSYSKCTLRFPLFAFEWKTYSSCNPEPHFHAPKI